MTYDIASGRKFVVHKPNGVNVQFTIRTDGLHYHDTNQIHLTLVHTFKKTSEVYIQNHIRNAKIARKLKTKVGHPITHDLKKILNTNQIVKCPVTVAEIDHS